jgi:N-acetylglucosaminyldiphosphoundecaprenol N-acetyl-beta-D-mannosaminyltransferase
MDRQRPRFAIGGVRIDAIRLADAIETIDAWVRERRRDYVVLTGAHGVVEMQRDEELRAINNAAGLVTPDGMSVVWVGRLRGFRQIEKVYAPDLMRGVFAHGVQRGYRHFLYGGDEGVADLLAGKLRAAYTGIDVVGTHCPPFRPLTEEETADVAAGINASRADIVWVGIGCPKQERWMARFRPLLDASVLVGVGAGFDFLAGAKAEAPAWIKYSGFEWLFRLAFEPRRLWPRYSEVVPGFLRLALAEELTRLAGVARRPS